MLAVKIETTAINNAVLLTGLKGTVTILESQAVPCLQSDSASESPAVTLACVKAFQPWGCWETLHPGSGNLPVVRVSPWVLFPCC